MSNNDLNGRDEPDYPNGLTCLETGQTYSDLDCFNIDPDGGENWQPFVSESAWMTYMKRLGGA